MQINKSAILTSLVAAITLFSGAMPTYAAYYYLTPALHAKIKKLPTTPVTTLKIPVMFGVTTSDLKDTWSQARSAGRTHEGVDIVAPTGTPVASPTEAVVIGVGFRGYGGNYVFTANPGDEKYYYAHLDSIASGIKVGSIIKAGDIIGYVGNTGNGEGGKPHLHFGIYKNVTTAPINPFSRLTEEFTMAERTAAAKKLIATAVTDNPIAKKLQQEYTAEATEGPTKQSPKPSATSKVSSVRVLKAGSTGADVKVLQASLNTLMKTKLKPDGRYGRGTSQAVRVFQKKHDLIVTGIAGAVTQAKITELLAQ